MNTLHSLCLRPKPECSAAYFLLFDQLCKLHLRQSQVAEKMHAAANAREFLQHTVAELSLDALRTEERRLLDQMRPLQDVAWERVDTNLVTNVGRNDILDKYWRGSGYTQTVVMGLKGTGTVAAADTQASHAGWSEVGLANAPTYTGNRKAVTMNAASSQSSVSPQQTYAITSTGTVAGMFMNNGGSATIDNTTGTLTSAVDFTGGSQAVNNGDTLLVTYTFNA